MTRRTIVIADDEAFLTQILSFNIQKSGAEVFVASNGAELCALAEARQPDLIITDFQMPQMDGLTACQKLKKNPRTAGIPVLMLTARGHRLTPEDLEQTNIRFMLSKPFSVRDVIGKIEQILHRESEDTSPPVAPGSLFT